MKTSHSTMWKWCAGLALAAGLFVAAPQVAQADVYLGRDGGLEGTATVDNTVQTAAQAGKWTKNNASQAIAEETTIVRSGGKSIKIDNSTTSGRRTWTPLLTFGSKTTAVTIQYYRYITNSTSFQSNQVGVIRASESLQGTYDKPASINTWEKKTYSPSSATFTTIAGVIMHRAATLGAGSMFVDDLCIYDGSADTIAPPIAGALTITTNSVTALDLSWVASADVDGGGYLVVRYAASPAATDDPNVNGIYATNNTIAGSVNGTVVYQGAGLSFTDSGLTTDQTYYYKLYTYDKAYNYSAETEGSGTPAGASTSAPSVTTVAAGSIAATTATANGDVTDDGGDTVTERGVCYKTSAGVAITDNKTAAAAGGTGTYSVDLSSLSVNQIYYFKAYASNSIGETLAANELNFTTLANVPDAPTVANPTATTLDVAVNENGNPASTEFAILQTNNTLYLQADGSFGASAVWATKSAWGTKMATGLASETTYFFQVMARNGANVETAFGGVTSNKTSAAPTGIWINPTSAGTPMGSYYLGDTLGDWNVNFEIGQASWDYAQIGLGTSAAGAGYNWGVANWYEDGDGSNKRVRRNLSGIQFTAAGSYYVICQARANSGDAYTSKSGNGWDNKTAYPPADLSSAYFTVDALSNPSGLSAGPDTGGNSATRADLSWTQWNSKNVMITIATATPTGSPTQGQAYSANDTFGNQTVVAGSQSGGSLEVTGLLPGQTYYFTFYSVNSSYYSAGATASSVTLDMPQARNTSGGFPEEPAGTIYLGDSGLTFGFDSWGQIEANYGAARLWLRYDNADLRGGTAGDWTGFVNDEHKTRTSGVFNQTGIWYWGMQMDYGSPYGTNFWYEGLGSGNWAAMATSISTSSGSNSVWVSAINDAADQTATRSTTAPSSAIDLTWSQNAQSHDVMVVRKLAAASWTEPTQGTAYAASDAIGAGTVVYNGALTAASATGLTEGSTYDFKFYSVNNDYYAAGVTAQASTLACEPDAPTGLGAVPGYTDFTASWTAADRATGYRLDVSTVEEFGIAGIPGSIYTADLEDAVKGGYASGLTTNNGVVWTFNDAVVGTLANDRKNGSRSARMRTNNTVSGCGTLTMNSDTNMGLSSITLLYAVYGTDTVGDSGQVEYSTNSGSSWVSAGTFTANSTTLTLFTATNINVTGNVRVRVVKTTGTSRLNIDDIKLYPYAPATPSFVPGFEDLAVAGTSVSVTGLTEGVTYYFRVRAEGEGGCPSVNSTTANTTTLLHLRAVLGQTDVNVREAGEGRFFVRLNQDPGGTVVVNVSRSAGDPSLAVTGGAVRTFNSSCWNDWQTVVLAQAADDGNTVNEEATFQVSLAGADDQFVAATALDDDIAENLALASSAATISGTGAYSRPEQLIDGVHNSNGNFGYTVWTNLSLPGTITLDLKATATVSRVRMLNWDWMQRGQRYKIDSSSDGSNWTLLLDASGEEHRGWDDWAVANQAMRYLRFTGLSNTVNQCVVVSELEVYGTRDLSGLSQPELLRTTVNVREGGDGRFFVRLNKEPTGPVVVNVERSSGSESISIQGGATRTFNLSNWNVWQAVMLTAGEDENSDGETAVFRVSRLGVADQFVTATTLDDEIGENFALASGGSTIAGSKRPAELIDGLHNVATNYGYTIWTNDPQGTMLLDMKRAISVSRVRLLNWDWVCRFQRYTIESSVDGSNWSPMLDASGEDHQGWDDWAVSDRSARFLRLTGVSNSSNPYVLFSELEVYGDPTPLPEPEFSKTSVNVREGGQGNFFLRLANAPTGDVVFTITRFSGSESISVQGGTTRSFTLLNWNTWMAVVLAAPSDGNADSETATFRISAPGYADTYVTAATLDDDIAENLALASGGATISGWKANKPGLLIDGVHTVSANYGYTLWTNVPSGTITLDLKDVMTVSRVRLLGWDWVHRVQSYTIESSTDGASWSMLADASAVARHGWDDWAVADEPIRYLRFTGVSNSVNQFVCISELEVYGTRPAGKRALLASAPAESEPATVVTSDDVAPDYESGWAAVDGDPETAWTGQKAGGGYILVGYEPTLQLKALEVDMAEGSLAGIQYLYSLDAQDWKPLPEDMESNPVSLNFLWLVFPDDGTEAVPEVFEIRPNP